MTEPVPAAYIDRIIEIIQDLIRLRPGLKTMLPENLARFKQHLAELHPEGSYRRIASYDLHYRDVFLRIGIVLSQHRDPMTMSELSEALAVPLSTATRLVDWLVESGYAERLPDPQDRRIVRVALTAAGRELYETINRHIRRHVEELLQRFTPEERDCLVVLLRKVVEFLQDQEEAR